MTRYQFQGEISLQTPLHIGSGAAGRLTDSPIRLGADGRPLLPGTSLGGLLRFQAERLAPDLNLPGGRKCKGPDANVACDCLTCQVFGEVNPGVDDKPLDRTCRLVIYDATLQNPRTPPVEIRDGIGISRRRQTVGQNLKFDWEVLSRGAIFKFEAYLETGGSAVATDIYLQLFCAAVAEMIAGRVYLGGRSGRGMGRCRLNLTSVNNFSPTTLSDLKKFLKTPSLERGKVINPTVTGNTFVESQLNTLRQHLRTELTLEDTPNFVELELALTFDYGVLINQPSAAALEGGDNAFVRTAHDAEGRPTLYLPGSSVRGALRSQAERIARTLSYARARTSEDKYEPTYDYDTYVKVLAACDPTAVPRSSEKDELEPTGHKYAPTACSHYLQSQGNGKYTAQEIEENSCLACQLFGNSFWAGRIKISDAFPLAQRPLDPKNPNTQQRLDFVAIDRFAGGARDTAKFEAYPHFSGANAADKLGFGCTLSLRDLRLPKDRWMLGWLVYLLSDLLQSDIRLGYGKTKGLGKMYGQVQRITFGSLKPDPNWLTSGPTQLGWVGTAVSSGLFQLYSLDTPGLSPQIQTLLQEYVGAFDQEIARFERRTPNNRHLEAI